ncbi:rod shape-determining protein MreC [Chitinophaga horti]|uniref:Cell shape-determining protein MreC n=1 Tax=Chitinophaga horti TaxID=2920382 RepID=A0ABY6J0N8_9BACT|nr:rod shape-determining protein MreC [Chitinophaga horti]UYQ93233.1 rod shape-determining protein MreC [Chitinophaga horti]
MRNLIIFFRRYFNFFLFLLLEVICIAFVFRNNNYQRTVYINSSNNMSGRLYTWYNDVQYYFHLKSTNDSLVRENARLHNELLSAFNTFDTTRILKADTLRKFSNDTMHRVIGTEVRRYHWLEAKVINNSVTRQINYITINRGSKYGIKPNMGVVGPSGVVGVVRNVSENYATVISLLSKTAAFGFSARLYSTREMGTVVWDGSDGGHAIMKDVPKSAKIKAGDTVVTSGYSALFPENIPIGYIESFSLADKSSTAYTIRLKLATNFFNVQYVYAIDNLLKDEQAHLEDSTYKQIK